MMKSPYALSIIQLKAENAGITPQQHVDNISNSIKEIVEILNISESAVKKRLERGREMIRKEMEVSSC